MQTTVVMPLRIAWPESFDSQFWNVIDISSDIIFVFDVGINFLYVQEDQYGGFILNLKALASEYLQSWFIVDCVSSVPISVIMISLSTRPANQTNIMSIKFIKLLKLFTLYRLLTLARITRLFKNNKLFEYLLSKINISSDV
jgi:Ion transport protein